jgi:hypothetical protein
MGIAQAAVAYIPLRAVGFLAALMRRSALKKTFLHPRWRTKPRPRGGPF